MRLEQTNYDNSETGCCAKLDVKHAHSIPPALRRGVRDGTRVEVRCASG